MSKMNMDELPPPPYEERDSHNGFDNEKLKPLDADVDVKSISSVESQSASSEGRTFHVYNDNWKGRDGKIYDSDKRTVLYELAKRNRKPQVTIRAPSSATAIGTLEFSNWARKMDAEVHGNRFHLDNNALNHFRNVDVHYDSPAFGQHLTWKRSTIWAMVPLTLVDEQQVAIARFEPVQMAKRKFGRLHVLRSDLSQDQLDEIVLTGLGVNSDTYFYTTQNAA